MKSKTFCTIPWNQIATTPKGNLRVCCNGTPGKTNITNDNNADVYIYRDDIEEIWNNKCYKDIRRAMINGERLEMCGRCYAEEDAGATSARQVYNELWYDENKDYQETEELNIRYVDIRLGNLCNLKCRMCSPHASDQWIEEWNELYPEQKDEVERLKHLNWPENEQTWKNLFKISDTVKEIYLTGGEPTIIKEQHILLDYFIDNGLSNEITLKYNTNLTNIPNHLMEKWKKFKHIKLNCSIDATGDLNKYIRYPSNWKKISENFEKIRLLDNISIQIHCTVQMYNILNLAEFLDWANKYNYRIHLGILYAPSHLSICCLPKELKTLAEERLERYKDFPRVEQVINYMNSNDLTEYYDTFVEYTKKIDKMRNENIQDLIPEFKI